mmetsp:Transcript_18917/g.39032  ORF Transcript_18917/g.39032 Transcript_18917/m.39032 type:complete len:91 (-) Transcript_18917:201-473(-)
MTRRFDKDFCVDDKVLVAICGDDKEAVVAMCVGCDNRFRSDNGVLGWFCGRVCGSVLWKKTRRFVGFFRGRVLARLLVGVVQIISVDSKK